MSPTKSSTQKQAASPKRQSPKKSPSPSKKTSPSKTPTKEIPQLASPSPATRTRSKSPVAEDNDDDESDMSMDVSESPVGDVNNNHNINNNGQADEMLISLDSPPKMNRQLYPNDGQNGKEADRRLSFPSIFKTKPQTFENSQSNEPAGGDNDNDEDEVSMDMTQVNKPAPLVDIGGDEDEDDNQTMEMTRTIGNIQQNGEKEDKEGEGDDDDNNQTMEMTRSIGGIRNEQNEEEDDDDDNQTMEMTRSLGGIQRGNQNEEEQEEEQTMDITKSFGGIRDNHNNDDTDMSMEITRPIGGIQNGRIEEEDEGDDDDDMEMEQTQALGRITRNEEDEMEMTQAIGSINLESQNKGNENEEAAEEEDDDDDVNMEVTQPLGTIQQNKRPLSPQKEAPTKRPRPSTPEKQKMPSIPDLQHPSQRTPSRTPIQSLKDGIMSLTPRRSASQQQRRTPRKQKSPSPQKEQQHHRVDMELVSHTPLKKMKGLKVPGPTPSPMKKQLLDRLVYEEDEEEAGEENNEPDNYQNIGLSEFLNTVNIDFMDDFLTSTRGHSSFGLVTETTEEPKLVDYVVAGQRIAVFGVFDFSIREMRNNVRTAKEMFAQFEEDTLEENPQLFREYLEATPDTKQIMNSQFKLMKTFTREQAKNVWYTWRSTLIKDVHKVLEKNLSNLKEDEKLLESKKPEIENEYDQVSSKFSEMKRKLEAMRKRQQELDSVDRETIIGAQNTLAKSKKELGESKEKLEKQTTQVRTARENIEQLLIMKRELQEQIQQAEKVREQHRRIESEEINELKNVFYKLQSSCGIFNVKLNGIHLAFNVDSKLKLLFNLETKTAGAEILCDDTCLHFFKDKIMENLSNVGFKEQLETIKTRWTRVLQINHDLQVLQLKHMSKISINNDKLVIKLRLHLPNSKLIIKVQIDPTTLESYPVINGSISMSNIYGDECSLEETCKKLESKLSTQGIPGVSEECTILIK